MQQQQPGVPDVAGQQLQQADQNKAAAYEWLSKRVADSQALYLTISHQDVARVTYRGFLGHNAPHYFFFRAAPGHEVHGIDFNIQRLEMTAPREGTALGTYVTIYRPQQSAGTGEIYRLQMPPYATEITIHTAPIY
jgi:hypothetical protein